MTDPTSSPPPPGMPALERELMEEVWRHGETTVREVLEALNARHARQRAYTTVMTVMHNLHEKGLLTRRREGKTDLYAAAIQRQAYVEARARAEVGALLAEYGDIALAHFAREMDRLDPARRDQLPRLAGRG